MINRKIFLSIITMLTMFLFVVGCTQSPTGGVTTNVDNDQQIIELGLNREGYTPSVITVKVDSEVILMNDGTIGGCGLYVVQPELGINANFAKSDTYSFTPTETGTFTYGCTMGGMFKGTIEVI